MNPVTDCHPPRLPDRDQGQTQPGATGPPTLGTPLSSGAIRAARRPAPPLPACGPRTDPQRDSLVLHTGALNFHSWGQTQNSQKILTPKSPVSACARAHTHTHTPSSVRAAVDKMDTHSQVLWLRPPPHAPAPLGWLGTRLEANSAEALGWGNRDYRGERGTRERKKKRAPRSLLLPPLGPPPRTSLGCPGQAAKHNT